MKSHNFVRKVRDALGMTQNEFAQAINRSFSMVRLYEHGADVPDEVREVINRLAKANGLADIAIEASKPAAAYQVKRIIEPTEVLISSGAGHPRSTEKWQQMLYEILMSGNAEVIAAVQTNLVVLHNIVAAGRTTKSTVKTNTRKA